MTMHKCLLVEECQELIPQQHLGCRRHWTRLRPETQASILDAHRRRDRSAWANAVEVARLELGV